MTLFSPKKKRVLVAEEDQGAIHRKVYDYQDVRVRDYDREKNGQTEHVPPSVQRRQVRADDGEKPSFWRLRRKKPVPTPMQRAGDGAGRMADHIEK